MQRLNTLNNHFTAYEQEMKNLEQSLLEKYKSMSNLDIPYLHKAINFPESHNYMLEFEKIFHDK
jgi:hypothetical protein